MNKTILMIGATIGMTAGSFVPFLFGDDNLLGGWSLLCSMIGGFVGIWLGVKLNKRLG